MKDSAHSGDEDFQTSSKRDYVVTVEKQGQVHIFTAAMLLKHERFFLLPFFCEVDLCLLYDETPDGVRETRTWKM